MNKCRICGKEYVGKFCPYCGTPLDPDKIVSELKKDSLPLSPNFNEVLKQPVPQTIEELAAQQRMQQAAKIYIVNPYVNPYVNPGKPVYVKTGINPYATVGMNGVNPYANGVNTGANAGANAGVNTGANAGATANTTDTKADATANKADTKEAKEENKAEVKDESIKKSRKEKRVDKYREKANKNANKRLSASVKKIKSNNGEITVRTKIVKYDIIVAIMLAVISAVMLITPAVFLLNSYATPWLQSVNISKLDIDDISYRLGNPIEGDKIGENEYAVWSKDAKDMKGLAENIKNGKGSYVTAEAKSGKVVTYRYVVCSKEAKEVEKIDYSSKAVSTEESFNKITVNIRYKDGSVTKAYLSELYHGEINFEEKGEKVINFDDAMFYSGSVTITII